MNGELFQPGEARSLPPDELTDEELFQDGERQPSPAKILQFPALGLERRNLLPRGTP